MTQIDMKSAILMSKSDTYDGDYSCIMRCPRNEFIYGPHFHDFYEFVIYLGNAGIFRIEDGEYLVRRGDIVLIDIFKAHTLLYNKTESYERFSVSIDLGLLISFSTPECNLLDIFHKCSDRHPIYHLEEQQLQKYLNLLNDYMKNQMNKGKEIREKALVHQLLAYIYSDCHTGEYADATDSRHTEIIARLISYINTHLSEDFSLAQLSAEVNYSEYYVCRLFSRLTGKPLTKYIQEKRIREACCLLKSHHSITQAAEQVGFNNYSYFYKTFKKIMGMGPAEYQNHFQLSGQTAN